MTEKSGLLYSFQRLEAHVAEGMSATEVGALLIHPTGDQRPLQDTIMPAIEGEGDER